MEKKRYTEGVNYLHKARYTFLFTIIAIAIAFTQGDLPGMRRNMLVVAVIGVAATFYLLYKLVMSSSVTYLSLSRMQGGKIRIILIAAYAVFACIMNAQYLKPFLGDSEEVITVSADSTAMLFAPLLVIAIVFTVVTAIEQAEELTPQEFELIANRLGYTIRWETFGKYGYGASVYRDGARLCHLCNYETVGEAEAAYNAFTLDHIGRNTKTASATRTRDVYEVLPGDEKYVKKGRTEKIPIRRYETECGVDYCAVTLAGRSVTVTETRMYNKKYAEKFIRKLHVC